jgi:preprotein translocase subunit SecA
MKPEQPLIIAARLKTATDKYAQANAIVKNLTKNKDFTVDEKDKKLQNYGKEVLLILNP